MTPDEEAQTEDTAPAEAAAPAVAGPAGTDEQAAEPQPSQDRSKDAESEDRGERGDRDEGRGERDSGDRDDGDRGRGGGRRRFFGRRKVCTFCVDKTETIDYKDPAKLRRYVSDRGRIEARRRTGTCAKHQRWLAVALKRARHLALLPYSPEHIRVTGAFASRR